MTLAMKLALVSSAVLVCALGVELAGLATTALRDARAHADEELLQTTRATAQLLSTAYENALSKSHEDLDILLTDLGWSGRLNEYHDETGSRRRLLAGDRAAVDAANARLDRFAQVTGADGAILARSGDDFVRVATSLRLRDGTRATGTVLDRHHPAYARLLRGEEYHGPSFVMNRQRMGRFAPIFLDGRVVGAIVAGSSLTQTMNELADSLRLMHPVQSGIVYAVMLAPAPVQGRILGPLPDVRIDERSAEAAQLLRVLQAADEPKLLDLAWSAELPAAGAESPTGVRRLAVLRDPRWNLAIVSQVPVAEVTRGIVGSIWIAVAATGAVLAVLIAVKVLLARHYVARPLEKMIDALASFSERDLTRSLQLDRQDEIGRLTGSMEQFRLQLLGALCAVKQNAGSLSAASTRIASGSKNLSLRTDEQIDLLKYTFSAMTELHERLRSNTDSARQATALAQDASRMASQGGADVERFVRTMEAINRSSKTIEGIVSVIDGIAFQTNILALNAAVEAARAGEQGRGFAVVASEVRLLAQRSADAARQIKALVSDSVGEVEEGVRVVQEAGRSIAAVVEATRRVSELFERISASTEEQQNGILRVEEAVTCLDRATQQNVGLVKESASAAEGLMGQARGLDEAVGTFRLGVEETAATA